MVATLERIVEEESLQAAAEKLAISDAAASRRKERIEELLGLSLDCCETREMMSLYLKIWRLSQQD